MSDILSFTQNTAHNGFSLKSKVFIEQPIALLIGKNGSGKSRFFESLKDGSCTAQVNDSPIIPTTNIILITPSELNPQFATNHDDTIHTQHVVSTIRNYEAQRALFDAPFVPVPPRMAMMNSQSGLTYEKLHKLILSIATKTNKKPSALSHEDIKLHYEMPQDNVLGGLDVAAIFNRYVKRLHENRYNRWRCTDGDDVPAYSDEDFKIKFGDKPWLIVNKILDLVFDGKFRFPVPDQNSKTYDFQTPLLELNDRAVLPNQLSSGEKTLLWMTLSLFNTQYHDRELFAPPKILLLDEPDAYLHPKMVEKMYLTLSEFNQHFKTKILLISHSPTTAALAPDKSIYLVEPDNIVPIDKDQAIAELLDGVPHLSIDPENGRHVYVESIYDSQTFQCLFNYLKKNSEKLNPKISISFISSGPKFPRDQLAEKVRQVLEITDEAKLKEFVAAVNGVGSCSHVYGAVDSLNAIGRSGIKGLVDWDNKNSPTSHVHVFAENYAYTIENVLLDPICVLLQLHLDEPSQYSIENFCSTDIPWAKWLERKDLLQRSLDYFLKKVLDDDNAKDKTISYMSGFELQTDNRYLVMQKNGLEDKLFSSYPILRRNARPDLKGELKFKIIQTVMIGASKGALIPSIVEQCFLDLQK
jgi:energy-coupling factor transporter ATP-binding protein EcfA2